MSLLKKKTKIKQYEEKDGNIKTARQGIFVKAKMSKIRMLGS